MLDKPYFLKLLTMFHGRVVMFSSGHILQKPD